MRRDRDLRSLLRWYPSSWRARYEDEFLAFLEDRLADSALTTRFRMSVALAGVRERCFRSGIVGSRSSISTQRRTGSLMVLVAWSIMMIGGASLAKTAEHYSSALPARSRTVAAIAYNATAVAGVVGMLLVLAGACVALPGFVRFIRAKKWTGVRSVFAMSLVASATLIVATLGLSLWAHHLTSAQRNGSDNPYAAAFVAFVLLVVVTVALWTRASVAAALRIELTPRQLRWESGFAIGVSLSSIAAVVGAALWWNQMGLYAPQFLNGTTGAGASPWSTRLVAIILVMGLGAVTALWGASRVALTYRPMRLNA
jgi:hypothetical protein